MNIGDLVTHRSLGILGVVVWINPRAKQQCYVSIEVYVPTTKQKVFWKVCDVEVICT